MVSPPPATGWCPQDSPQAGLGLAWRCVDKRTAMQIRSDGINHPLPPSVPKQTQKARSGVRGRGGGAHDRLPPPLQMSALLPPTPKAIQARAPPPLNTHINESCNYFIKPTEIRLGGRVGVGLDPSCLFGAYWSKGGGGREEGVARRGGQRETEASGRGWEL